jgi:leucyl-tRNA synthetase
MQEKYIPREIESKVQGFWKTLGLYRAEDSKDKKKYYCLDMFPYPSGEGLHVGHVEGYTATDIFSRYKRMNGYDVLHPMGWDAFGLPAENTAIKQKTHPRKLVEKNVARFKTQLRRMGFSYDWSREINTTDPEYYKWTQWIFLKLFHLGLAYEAVVPINWCPSCKTGLANEEVVAGKCERCGTEVEKKDMRQWMLGITKYSERLLRDLDGLDWPDGIKELQRNWIGRSEGAIISFKVADKEGESIEVFTTRIDTIFSGTFVILAPEHRFIESHKGDIKNWEEVNDYRNRAKSVADIERTAKERVSTGVALEGLAVINPATGEKMPIWIADFVLAQYGTGAVFADAHDRRDFDLAKKYNLPLKVSIRPKDDELFAKVEKLEECFEEEGVLFNSLQFDGLESSEAREKIIAWLQEKGLAKKEVNYKLRDWVFSRQRYWGEPIPVVHCDPPGGGCGVVAVPENQLPVLLPEVENYEPTGTGESPLAAIESWVSTICPKCGEKARRETNTMPQWAGSCWYFLRFIDPNNHEKPWDWQSMEKWLPVDLYVGGAEHAVLHLLYARFWVKALFDGGFLPFEEPFHALRNQGTIMGPDGQKMSKSKGNVINPDEIIEKYGADALRLYEMFLGPFEANKPWDDKAINGVSRFLYRIWKIGNKDRVDSADSVSKATHKLIKKVGDDIESLKFNTAISAMMEFVNLIEKEGISKNEFEKFLLILSPFAPHLAEDLWQKNRDTNFTSESVTTQKWPSFDAEIVAGESHPIILQVNGKVRDTMTIQNELEDDELKDMAEKSEKMQVWLEGKEIVKVIVVKNRLVNFVVREA